MQLLQTENLPKKQHKYHCSHRSAWRWSRVRGRASAGGDVVHDSLVGELGERVEANRLRGGQLSLRDKRLDLVGDRLASAEVVGGLDDRGDVLPARTSAEGRAADDGR